MQQRGVCESSPGAMVGLCFASERPLPKAGCERDALGLAPPRETNELDLGVPGWQRSPALARCASKSTCFCRPLTLARERCCNLSRARMLVTLAPDLMHLALRRRLRLPVPITRAFCGGEGLRGRVDTYGDHFERCPRTGLLALRGFVVDWAWVQVAREAVGPEWACSLLRCDNGLPTHARRSAGPCGLPRAREEKSQNAAVAFAFYYSCSSCYCFLLGGLTRIAVRKYTFFGVQPAGRHLRNGPGML